MYTHSVEGNSFKTHCSAMIAVVMCQIWWKFVNYYFWRYSKNWLTFFWRRCRKPVSL